MSDMQVNSAAKVNGALIQRRQKARKAVKNAGAFMCRVGSVAKSSLDSFESTLWPYLNEGRKMVKGALSIVKISKPELEPQLSPVIAKLGLVSGLSVVFSLKDVASSAMHVVSSLRIREIEGAALSAIGMVVGGFDALDSWMTFHGALASFGWLPQVAFFSTIGLPVTFFLLGTGTALGAYKSMWNFIELYKMRNVRKIATTEGMQAYLQQRVGASPKEKAAIERKLKSKGLEGEKLAAAQAKQVRQLKARKWKVVARHHGDARVVNIMRNMQQALDSGTTDLKRTKLGMRDIQRVTIAHGVANTVSTLFNASMLSTVIATTAGGCSPYVAPAVALAKSAFQIGKHILLKPCIGRLLRHNEFTKPLAKQ